MNAPLCAARQCCAKSTTAQMKKQALKKSMEQAIKTVGA
jgi:hypothetical protein